MHTASQPQQRLTVAERLKAHLATVTPGKSFRLTAVHGPGDGVWQGDLGIEIVEPGVPAEYERVTAPTDADRQLAVENGAGSHHRLASLDGVTIYRPPGWGRRRVDLEGPYLVLTRPNAIVHEPGHSKPHGTVFIDAPCAIRIRYQRNLDLATGEPRRAMD